MTDNNREPLRITGLLSVLIIFFSCNGEKEIIIPDDVISPDSMVTVMVELHIAESTIMLNRIDDDQSERNALYIKHTLDAMEVDSALFNRSFDFYTSHPEIFSQIYEEVIEELNRRNVDKNAGVPGT